MNFLEKNLEDIIFETPNDLLHERGFFIFGKKKRQVKIGNYGIADIITYHRAGGRLFINILELKKDKISTDTLLQSLNYAKGVSRYLQKRSFDFDVSLRIKLIGREIDTNSSFCYLPDFFNSIEIYTYDYGFDGIHFKMECDYKLTNEGFGFDVQKMENENITSEPF